MATSGWLTIGVKAVEYGREVHEGGQERGAGAAASGGRGGAGTAEMMADAGIDLGDHRRQAAVRIAAVFAEFHRKCGERGLHAMRKIGDVATRGGKAGLVLVDQRVQFADDPGEFLRLVGGHVARVWQHRTTYSQHTKHIGTFVGHFGE